MRLPRSATSMPCALSWQMKISNIGINPNSDRFSCSIASGCTHVRMRYVKRGHMSTVRYMLDSAAGDRFWETVKPRGIRRHG